MLQNFQEDLEKTGLIVILRGVPGEMLGDVLDALYDGGIRLAEVTYDAAGIVPPQDTAASIAMAVKRMTGKMHIGAGTVLTEEQLRLTKEAGGTFIISPHTNPTLIVATKELGLFSLPGAMTVSEIVTAHKAGADFVKLFPASTLGPDFIKQVHGPLPHVKLLAVSGVGVDDIPAYRKAGAAGFGVGSAIVSRSLCTAGKLDVIQDNAARFAKACLRDLFDKED